MKLKHGDIVDHTPAGNAVVYVSGIWGTARALQGYTEDDAFYISCGDTEGVNDYHSLNPEDAHQVAAGGADGEVAWTICGCRDAAYRVMDQLKAAIDAGEFKPGRFNA